MIKVSEVKSLRGTTMVWRRN